VFVIYFVIGSVRKLLDTTSYTDTANANGHSVYDLPCPMASYKVLSQHCLDGLRKLMITGCQHQIKADTLAQIISCFINTR